ncbi:hypothetical protein QFC20_006376 [Naganishia adeliensis]|uniref:Uncharacterized protein n=1 Tax=Naganishia adeliensis TaxID=92952 RepID=A0ACC2VCA1_9TREE|nr:hypothetical protein QFC20_006376 [Naganishia adeliensis]
MAPVVDPSAAYVIVEEAGDDPDQWPKLRDSHRRGKQDKVQWGKGVRSEEEVYLAKLESKLAKVKTGGRAAEDVPQRELAKEDLFDTSVSLASSPSEHDYLSEHTADDSEDEVEEDEVEETHAKPLESDNPGLPLLWDQPSVEVEEEDGMEEKLDVNSTDDRSLPVTPDRSRSLVIRSSERPGLTSNDSKVRFFGRVRVTSGRRAVSSQYRARSPRITTPPVAPKSLSSSIASSVTMSLRGTPTSSWLFPSMTPLGTPAEAPAKDYFSYVSPASSIRRSGTMTPRDPEVEEVAARAARARALTWAPNRRTSSSDARDKIRRGAGSNGHLMLKTEDGVIWGSWKTRLTTLKWWTWKMRRVWYAIQKFWCQADDEEDDEERRMFVRE